MGQVVPHKMISLFFNDLNRDLLNLEPIGFAGFIDVEGLISCWRDFGSAWVQPADVS